MSSARGNGGRTRAGGAVLFAAALVLLAFAGPLLSGERFCFRDVSQNHGPVIEGARHLLQTGEPPWWNPWTGGGKPLFANPNHLLATPTGWLALLLGSSMGLTLGALLGSLLASVFMALLLRDRGSSPWAAATGAVVLGFSGFGISLGTLPNLLAAAAWIPPALFFIGRTRRRLAWLPAAVLASAFVFAPCEPASALVLCVFALLLGAPPRDLVSSPQREGAHPAAESRRRSSRRGTLRQGLAATAGILALGLCAAACQVLPAALWIFASSRGSAVAAADASKWALSVWRLPELLAPGFLGDPSRFPSGWWGAPLFETGLPLILSLHLGGPVLLLAVWSAWQRGRAFSSPDASGTWRSFQGRVAELAVPLAGLGFFLLAILATPGRLSSFVPGADLFRYPEKFMLGVVLVVALETAAGADRLIRCLGRREEEEAGEKFPEIARPDVAKGERRRERLVVSVGATVSGAVTQKSGAGEDVDVIRGYPLDGHEVDEARGAFRRHGVTGGEDFETTDQIRHVSGPLVGRDNDSGGRGATLRKGPPGSFHLLHGETALLLLAAAGLGIVLLLGAIAIGPDFVMRWFSLPAQASGLIGEAQRGVRLSLWLGAGELSLLLVSILVIDRSRRRSAGPILASCVAVTLLAGALAPGAGPFPWRLRANPSVAASFYATSPFFAERLQRLRATGERVFRFDRPSGFAVRNRTGTIVDGFQWDRRSLGRSSASEFGVELAYDRSTDHLDPRGSDAALSFLIERPLEQQLRFWSLASVRLILSYRSLEAPGLAFLDRVEGESNVPLLLYENERCLPRVRLTSTLRSFPVESDAEAFERIAGASGDDWQEPQIEPRAGMVVDRNRLVRSHMTTPLPPVETGRTARIVERSGSRLRIRVEAAAPTAERRPENLVISENQVPGWRATLDGQDVPISRANGMHMSILIPDGAPHDVVLAYAPPGLLAGCLISVLALALAVLRAARGDGRTAGDPAMPSEA